MMQEPSVTNLEDEANRRCPYMRTASVARGTMAVSLATLLVSCSATRSSTAGPTSSRDLAKYAIVFEQQQDGRVTHAWVPLQEFDLTLEFLQRCPP